MQGAGEGRQDTAGYPHPHPPWTIHPDNQHFSPLSTPVKQMEGKVVVCSSMNQNQNINAGSDHYIWTQMQGR